MLKKGMLSLLVFLVCAALQPGTSQASTEVSFSGDVRTYGSYWNKRFFNGKSITNSATFSPFSIYQRVRINTDFVASEDLKFRFGMQVDDTPWGSGTYTYDNPDVSIQVHQAYLQYKLPGTEIQMTAGLQPFAMPTGSLFQGSLVMDTQAAVAAVELPVLGEALGLKFGYGRFISNDPNDDQSSTAAPSNNMDGFFLSVPMKVESANVSFTPWALATINGKNIPYGDYHPGTSISNQTLASNLLTLGTYLPNEGTFQSTLEVLNNFTSIAGVENSALFNSYVLQSVAAGVPASSAISNIFTANALITPDMDPSFVAAYQQMLLTNLPKRISGLRNTQNLYLWAGGSLEIEPVEQLKINVDGIYGQGNQGDRSRNKRSGYFAAVAAEYSGFDWITPTAGAWYGSGEDGSVRNGSERLPFNISSFNIGSSLLFDGGQAFANGYAGLSPVGSWGLVLSTGKMSFLEHLTHQVTLAYARGTNAARPLRLATQTLGDGGFYRMGRDLSVDEQIFSLTFDHRYKLYENLAVIAETGFAHGDFQKSIWGKHVVNQTDNGNMVKVALGLEYKF